MVNNPEYIICHHSLTKDSGTVSMSAIRDYHINVLKMDDIGYHVIIELVGNRYAAFFGRMPNQHGAHCKQQHMNYRSIGICFVGNFDKEKPAKEMFNLGLTVARYFKNLYGIPKSNVRGHRDFAPHKTCPGLFFNMGEFRNGL